MNTVAVAPYKLAPFEQEQLELARAELKRQHPSPAYAFGRRQGLLCTLVTVINRASAAAPLRMSDAMAWEVTEAVGLGMCKDEPATRAWLMTHHHVTEADVAKATAAGDHLSDVEYGAASGAALGHLQHMIRVLGLMTSG